MVKKKKDTITSIAELLPENLSENLVEQISKLLSEKIEEEVNKEIQGLTRKTVAFFRRQIEALKEQALKELELENETYRNAKMFESVKSFFSVELTGDDEQSAINAFASLGEEQDNKIEVLVNEVDSLVKENTKLKNSLKVVLDKNKMLESSVNSLSERVEITESNGKSGGKILSDSAMVVSEENFKKKEQPKASEAKKQRTISENNWLNEDVLEAFKALR